MIGKRPGSSRGRDIRAITEATSEVDEIVKSAKKTSHCKLRLLELLNAKMVMLETTVLRLADGARVFRNVSGNYGTASMSRLPAFLEIVDQLMVLQKAASRSARTRTDSEIEESGPGPLPAAINELEDEIKVLFAMLQLDMEVSEESGMSATRVAQCAADLKVIKAKGLRPLTARAVEAEATVSRLQNETEELHKKLEEAYSVRTTSKVTLGAMSGSLVEEKQQLAVLQREVENLRSTRGSADDATAEAVESVKTAMNEKVMEAQRELTATKADLAKARADLAIAQESLDEVRKTSSLAKSKEELAVKSSTAEIERVRAENKSLIQRLKVSEEKNTVLEAAVKTNGGGQGLNENLVKELEAAKEELKVKQRSIDGLDMYMKDLSEKRDLEIEECKKTIKKLKADNLRESAAWKAEDNIKKEHIASLKALVDRPQEEEDDDSFEEILREEMRVMKATFELKMSKLKEELAQKSIACSREVRVLKDKLEEESRHAKMYAAKLKGLEAKQQSST